MCEQVLDRDGVGKLVKMATAAGKAANPKLKVPARQTALWKEFCVATRTLQTVTRARLVQVGVCGEHGGEPSSIEFFASVVRGRFFSSPAYHMMYVL